MSPHSQAEPASGTENWNEYGKYRGRILHREQLAKNVHLYIVEKPEGFRFRPGQAVEMSIDKKGWREEKRPFTITSLPSNPRLEFVIKSYPTDKHTDHDGMTEFLGQHVRVNDRVIFGDAWGAIEYQGPGVFIAGGAGITPFIAILRLLEQEKRLDGNRLFFSNKSAEDVFLQGELFRCLGRGVVCTLTDESHRDYEQGRINREWLEERVNDFEQKFYVCGPPSMVNDVSKTLNELGVDAASVITEDTN